MNLTGPGLAGARVLLHAPSAAVAARFRDILVGAGALVREPSSLAAAVAEVREWAPDLVLLESEAMAVDLVGVCRALRSGSGPEPLPLVAIVPDNDIAEMKRAAGVALDSMVEASSESETAIPHLTSVMARVRMTARLPATLGSRLESLAPERAAAEVRGTEPGTASTSTSRFLGGRHLTSEVLRRIDGSRRLAETLLAQMHCGVIAADADQHITFVNRAAADALGFEIAQGHRRDLLDAFGSAPALEQALRRVPEGAETSVEFAFQRDSGARLDIEMSLVRTPAEVSAEMSYVLLFRDVTERRVAAAEARRTERLSAIGSLAAGFAHGVRNPLAGTQALAETLVMELTPEDPRQELARRMIEQLGRAESFLRAAIRLGEQRPARKRLVPVSVLVEEACTRLAASRPGGLSRPQVSIERGLAPTLCDQEQVADALTRLLENACDVASDPARVRVQACSAAGADRSDGADRLIQIDVIDEGPGIPDPLLVRIFDPFYTTKANHVGLGLPLAQKLVRENGGRLLATSRFGQGSTFSILMPGAGE